MDERRNFLGKVLAKVVVSKIKDISNDPGNTLKPDDIVRSERQMETAVQEAITKNPELQHITNTEKWYQKRSRWAAIIAGISPFLALGARSAGIEFGDAERDLVATGLATAGGLWAAYLAYRAGTATKPLGT